MHAVQYSDEREFCGKRGRLEEDDFLPCKGSKVQELNSIGKAVIIAAAKECHRQVTEAFLISLSKLSFEKRCDIVMAKHKFDLLERNGYYDPNMGTILKQTRIILDASYKALGL